MRASETSSTTVNQVSGRRMARAPSGGRRTVRIAWTGAPRRDERGVFAEAVAGEERRLCAAHFQPRPPGANSGGHHGRLGVDGAIQLLRRPFGDQLGDVLLQDIGRFGERRADHRHIPVGGEHAHRLRSLSGKDHGEIHLDYISTIDAPQVKPPPTAWSMSLCPGLMRPSRTARSSASGTDAADVLPWRSTVTMSFEGSIPSFFTVASSIRKLAWCGMSQSMSAAANPHSARVSRATSSSTFTANLNTACPSICRNGEPTIFPPQTLPGTERMSA